MPKADLRRHIDSRPQSAAHSTGRTVNASPAPPAPTPPAATSDEMFVGQRDGPHVGLFRSLGDLIFLDAVDTANVPFFSLGGIDSETNATWLNIGYADRPGIRLPAATSLPGAPEQHRGIEVDAETLVGVIPPDVFPRRTLRGRVVVDTTTEAVGDEMIVCNKGTAMTVNLLPATGSWRELTVASVGAGVVTITPDGANTVDGVTTQVLNQYDTLHLVDYATGAWKVA